MPGLGGPHDEGLRLLFPPPLALHGAQAQTLITGLPEL